MNVLPRGVVVGSGPEQVPQDLAVNPVRLNRGEYWLLREAVFLRLPLWSVALPEGEPWHLSIEAAFNHAGHGLSRECLARTLLRMARRGWIRLYRADPDRSTIARLRMNLRDLVAEFERRSDAPSTGMYELTPRGGSVWEAFARPDWQHHVDDECRLIDETESERTIVAATLRQLRRYLQALRAEVDVIAGSERYADVDEWTPAYWKPPMAGVRCTVRCVDKPPEARCLSDTELFARAWCQW